MIEIKEIINRIKKHVLIAIVETPIDGTAVSCMYVYDIQLQAVKSGIKPCFLGSLIVSVQYWKKLKYFMPAKKLFAHTAYTCNNCLLF